MAIITNSLEKRSKVYGKSVKSQLIILKWIWSGKKVSMVRKYHNHTLQTSPRHQGETREHYLSEDI